MSSRKRYPLLVIMIALSLFAVFPAATAAQDVAVRVIPVTGELFDSRLSPDGHTLAIYENAVLYDYAIIPEYVPIRLINLDIGAETLLNAGDYAGDVAWSADSAQLVSLHGAGWLVVWDVASGIEIKRVPIIPGQSTIALTPDATSVVWRNPGVTTLFAIWDLDTAYVTAFLTHRYATYGEFMERMSGGTIPDTTLAFALSPDGTTLAEATMYGRIWLWDLESSQPRLLRDTEEERPRLPIRDLTFTADGARLIYLDRDAEAILAMDVATGQETVLVETTTKMNPAVSADGAQLAWVDEDEWAIAIWHAALPTSLVSIPLSDLPELESGRGYRRGPLHFTPDGTRLIFAGFYAPDTGQNAILVIDLGQQ